MGGDSRIETRAEVRVLTRLAAPIILTNLCWMVIGTVDLVMLGRWRVPEEARDWVAAGTLANVWVHLTQMLGMGLVMGIDPAVTQGAGARDREALGRALQRGLILAVAVSLPVALSRFWTGEFLLLVRDLAARLSGGSEAAAHLELDAFGDLAGPAESYALAQSFAAPFFLAYIAVRQQLQGRGILKPALAVAVLANLVNVAVNRLFIYELEMGIEGAGLATGITRVFMALALALLLWRFRLLRAAWVPWSRASFALRGLARTMKHGVPVGLHFAFEIGAFGATALLAGLLGKTATTAHSVCINLASITFMVPLGIGLAATTRVGNLIGEGRLGDAQRSSHLALWMGALSMAALGALLLGLRHELPALYLRDAAEAIALAATILPIAAAFQVFDGLQVVGSGILRGCGRTLPAAVFNFVAWWVLALPMALWLVQARGGGLAAVWWSLAAGLGVVAVLMVVWVRRFGPRSVTGVADAR